MLSVVLQLKPLTSRYRADLHLSPSNTKKDERRVPVWQKEEGGLQSKNSSSVFDCLARDEVRDLAFQGETPALI